MQLQVVLSDLPKRNAAHTPVLSVPEEPEVFHHFCRSDVHTARLLPLLQYKEALTLQMYAPVLPKVQICHAIKSDPHYLLNSSD